MNRTIFALATFVLAASASAQVANTSSFTNGVQSYSGAMAATSGTGTSVSSARNTQFAINQGSSTATLTADGANGSANGVGVTGTTSIARNVSTGSGTGLAVASGASVVTQSTGVTFENGTAKGSVLGSLGSVAESGVDTGTNGAARVQGVNTVNYNGSAIGTQVLNSDFVLTNAANTTANATSVTNVRSGFLGTGKLTFATNVAGSAGVDANAKIGDAVSATPAVN